MTDTQKEQCRKIAEQLYKQLQTEASDKNGAYDWYGLDNTPQSVDPIAFEAVRLLRNLAESE